MITMSILFVLFGCRYLPAPDKSCKDTPHIRLLEKVSVQLSVWDSQGSKHFPRTLIFFVVTSLFFSLRFVSRHRLRGMQLPLA